VNGPFEGSVPPIRQEPPPLQVGADFVPDPANPQVGILRFDVGPSSFQLLLPSANVVPFLRSLADNIERKLGPAVQIARPVSGLFLPNGNGN
jgi:hypothetical protein